MQAIEAFSQHFVDAVWGLHMVYILFGAGLIFTLFFGFPQFKFFKHAIQIVMGKYDNPEDKGEINHFQALCAALSATLGLGNIAGVAVAVGAGGPGAIFWMWVAGFLGMATKMTEVMASLLYRDEKGPEVHGGPMFTIKNGLGQKWYPLAFLYALFAILSSFGAGNMFQSNQMASILNTTLSIPTWLSGTIFAVLAALVLIGGIKRIGNVTSKLVPIMVLIYLVGALGIIFVNIDQIPSVISSIFHDAFNGSAAVGGFAGIAFKEVVINGVRRAVFSNEAGMGSAAMAHSAAKSTPEQEGFVALLEPLIDTIFVCTITGVTLLLTDVWHMPGLEGSDMTAKAFETLYGPLGNYTITMIVVLFAFSTIISWAYYGEQGVVFIFGEKYVLYYRVVAVCMIIVGSVAKLSVVLNFSDAVFGLLAFPNLLSCLLLAPKLRQMVKDYHAKYKAGKIKAYK